MIAPSSTEPSARNESTGLIPTGSSAVFAIIGHPVVQVQSPGIFNRFFAQSNTDAVFVAFDVQPSGVADFFAMMRQTDNMPGGFVTVPHKQAAAEQMDELTDRASALGVVNAVKRVDGRLIGDATDGPAFLHATRGRGLDPLGKRVALVGGGGAASAIAHACAEQGVDELVLSVRNQARHERLRAIVESVANPPKLSFDLDSLAGFDLVINGTSVGMNDDRHLPHPVETLEPSSLVGEVVTRPKVTPWLAAALDRGCPVQYGADMARAQRQLVGPWWGLDDPPIDWNEEGR